MYSTFYFSQAVLYLITGVCQQQSVTASWFFSFLFAYLFINIRSRACSFATCFVFELTVTSWRRISRAFFFRLFCSCISIEAGKAKAAVDPF